MKISYKQWVDNLIPLKELLNPEELRRHRLFINVVVFTFFYAACYQPTNYIFDYTPAITSVYSTLLGLMLALFLLKKGIGFKIALHLYLGLIAFNCIYLIYNTGGIINSPYAPQWVAVPFILALLVGTRKIAVFYLIIAVAALAYFGISQIMGHVFPLIMNPEYILVFQVIAQIGFLITIYIIQLAFENTKRRAYDELYKMQGTLIQQEKMASLGTLTAGIAHEIKNPLNFVNNFSELSASLLDDIKVSDPTSQEAITMLRANLEKITHHGKRADDIVKSMLQHSRSSSGEKEKIDINKMCAEFVNLAMHGMKATTANFNGIINTQFDAHLPEIMGIKQDLNRVLLNLINNALYAIKDNSNGEVLITTSSQNHVVNISILDNGVGIKKEILPKLFEPFFTTKPSGEGTGLGLSISYDIVRLHGGDIVVDSEEGKFSQFTISLPLNGLLK